MKYLFWSLVIVAGMGLLGGVYTLARRPVPPASETVNNYQTTLPVETRIIYKDLLGKIVVVDGHEVASLDTTVASADGKTSVRLGVQYDERSNLFDLDTSVSSVRDSVYVEKPVYVQVPRKAPWLGLCAGIGVGFARDEEKTGLESVSLDAGVKLAGKYSVSAWGDTEKRFGVRFGVDF